MALRTRISPPFGRPSPAFREGDILPEWLKLMDERGTQRYETGFAARTRDCSGRTRVEMLDGHGGAALGLGNACDTGVAIGAGGVAEIFWAERSEGRTVRTLYDLGTRAGRVSFESLTFPAEREMPVVVPEPEGPTVYTGTLIAVGGGTSKVARSTDGGTTWAALSDAAIPSNPLCVATDGAGYWIIGGANTQSPIAWSDDDGETWTNPGDILSYGFNYTVRDIAHNGTTFALVHSVGEIGFMPLAVSADGAGPWTWVPAANCTGLDATQAPNTHSIRTDGSTFYAYLQAMSGNPVQLAKSIDNGLNWTGILFTSGDAGLVCGADGYNLTGYGITYPVAAIGNTLVVGGYNISASGLVTADEMGATPDFTGGSYEPIQDSLAWIKFPTLAAHVEDLGRTVVDLTVAGGKIFATMPSFYAGVGSWLFYLKFTDPVTWEPMFTASDSLPDGIDDLSGLRQLGDRCFMLGSQDNTGTPVAATATPLVEESWEAITSMEGVMQWVYDMAGVAEEVV
jgi:hypothetical protein